jgi:arsenical pump membrane protein
MPSLLKWLPAYLPASVLSIVATYLALRWTQRRSLTQPIATGVPQPPLGAGGKTAAAGLVATAVVLLACSAFDIGLGLPTAIAGAATAAIVLLRAKSAPWPVLKNVSWGILPLVAGLFVLVEALGKTGVIDAITALLRDGAQHSALSTAAMAGVVIAFVCNLVNNLPAGLLAGSAVQAAHVSDEITRTLLIGVDLGPNLSVTGSLATILWLAALRREGHSVGFLAVALRMTRRLARHARVRLSCPDLAAAPRAFPRNRAGVRSTRAAAASRC